MQTVSVIGVGYVGLTLAVTLANCGFRVMAVDKDRTKLASLASGKSGFYEPGLDGFLNRALRSGHLSFCDYEEAASLSSLSFICVGTPVKKNGKLDDSENLAAIKSVMKYAKKTLVIVQKSTVGVGTGDRILKLLRRGKNSIDYVASPEFLREGSALFDTLFFDRVVVGGESVSAKKQVVDVYRKICAYSQKIKSKSLEDYAFLYTHSDFSRKLPSFEKRIFSTDMRSAEMIKIVANSFLATKISFANMCANLCEKTGADTKMVLDAVGADRRIGRDFLYPGLGFGGSCLPKDLSAMIELGNDNGCNTEILKGVRKVNSDRPEYILEKLKSCVDGVLLGKIVVLLGVSFKGGTSDTRMSPALHLLRLLEREGAVVRVYDPHVNYDGASCVDEVFIGADLIVVASEWKEFLKLNFGLIARQVKKRLLYDARGIMNKKKLEKCGFIVRLV